MVSGGCQCSHVLLFGGVWCKRWSQEDANVLMFCCLVESGVRDGLRRMPMFSCFVVWWSLV